MANKTTNYGLTKPLPEEFYDVGVQNNNMDIIDEELKKRATLGDDGKVPEEQLPDTTFIPVTSEVPAESDIWIDPDDETVETSHLNDFNNPHKVNASQVGAVTMTKLWENASPDSSFSAQTIKLDLSAYDAVLISMCTGSNKSHVGTYLFAIGSGTHITYGAGAYMGRRNFKVTSTGVVVEGGSKYENSWGDSNAYQKPYTIYGLKGVIV